jgi:apolipoprotein N-acyltransferase
MAPHPLVRWLALAAGTLLLAIALHRVRVPLAAWLAPVFLLRFTRDSGWLTAAVGAIAAYLAGTLVAVSGGYLPFPTTAVVGLALLYAVVHAIPYGLDRALAGRLPAAALALALPTVMTAVEFLFARSAPFGTWGVTAYTQADRLALAQVVSVTGLWGLVFLLHALAPAANALWEARFEVRRAVGPALGFALLLAAAAAFGTWRLAGARAPGATIEAALVAPSVDGYRAALAGMNPIELATADAFQRAPSGTRFRALTADLLARSEAAAAAGARLIAWPETVPVLAEDLPMLVARAGALTPWVVRRTGEFPYVQNTSALLDPRGQFLWRYEKRHPVIYLETGLIAPGPGPVAIAQTRLGRLASAICQDLDFPWFIRQAAQAGADLLIGPTDDWPQIAGTHARMARLRAIETGLPLLRPTSGGISMIVDAYGRVLASADANASNEAPLVRASVPLGRVETPYARFGDWFAYASIAATVVLLAAAWRRRRVRDVTSPAASATP